MTWVWVGLASGGVLTYPVGQVFVANGYNSTTMKILFRIHAIERMFERGIGISEIRMALEKGENIEHYVDEATYPGRLIIVQNGKKTLHVVAADNTAEGEAIIVTGYRPDRRRWTDDFRRRRDEVPDL